MENSYAQALWRMVKSGKDAKKAVRALKDILAAHGRGALLPRIARAFARIAERDASRNDVVLTIAREKDSRAAHKQLSARLKELDITPKTLKTQIDDCLIGGWRLEGKETLIDNSYKKHLLSVYNRLTNA